MPKLQRISLLTKNWQNDENHPHDENIDFDEILQNVYV